MTSAGTAPQERLLNLVIGLASAQRPVPRAQIYETFVGYQDSASQSAFERLFERDKEILRRLGIPLITAPVSSHDDDVGYLIDARDYALPPIELRPEQARILTLAGTLWRDSAMHDAAERGVTKLRALGGAQDLQPPALDINPGNTTPAFARLHDAISARREVHFTYRAASTGAESQRRVQPWRITGRRGVWYLSGHDLVRGAKRIFRLDRIQGTVRARGPHDAFEIPPAQDDEDTAGDVAAPRVARVIIASGRGNALRLRAQNVESTGGATGSGVTAGAPARKIAADTHTTKSEPLSGDILTLPVVDVAQLASTIAALGEHAVVLEPADLRDRVIELLRGAAGVQDDGN